MTAVAIICEYNPFHTGHAYHTEQAKKLSGADCVIGVMSGFFVQRAEPAIISPQTRAHTALLNGMDIVIEIPAIFSCASGNIFAEGALNIISRIPSVKYLAMGTEDDGSKLLEIAKLQHEQPESYRSILKNLLSEGLPYAAAVTKATEVCIRNISDCKRILERPNNVLAIEYLKAIYKLGLDITPVFVPRLGNGYNDLQIYGEYISASAARNLLCEKRYDELRPYIPTNSFDMIISEYEQHRVNIKSYEAIAVHALRTQNVADAFDAAEGIDRKISENASNYCSLAQIIQASKSKRYTMSRIKRICLQTLLGITHSAMSISENAVGRLTAIKNSRRNCLNELTGVSIKNSDYKTFGDKTVQLSQIDSIAGSIYSLIAGYEGNVFWDRKLITI